MESTPPTKFSIKSIWIESEDHGPITNGQKYIDDNSDVIVTFTDETKFVATFFTYENILALRNKNRMTGECLNGKYFWASDMIIIDQIDRIEIIKVINDLISEEIFDRIFRKIS